MVLIMADDCNAKHCDFAPDVSSSAKGTQYLLN